MNFYRIEDVAKRNGQNGRRVWMVIKNSVYDLTDFMKEHPGGDDLILEYAGKDGTTGFNDIGHSLDAKNLMETFKIGELEEENYKRNRRSKGFNQKSEKSDNRNRRSILTKLWLCS